MKEPQYIWPVQWNYLKLSNLQNIVFCNYDIQFFVFTVLYLNVCN